MAKKIQNAGPYDPRFYDETYDRELDYDFGPSDNMLVLAINAMIDPLVVLGDGTLEGTVYIVATTTDD